ncbi:DoxX family protein, partial [Micromonospora humida]
MFLWIVQILLAALFAGAGLTKLIQPKEKLLDRMAWVRNTPPLQVKALGAAEVLAALGLVLPGLTGIAT